MATYITSNANDPLKSTGDTGNSNVYVGRASVSAALANADVIRPVKVAGGTKVHRVVVKNTDMDTNAGPTSQAKIGFRPVDGSAQAAGDDTAVAAAGVWAQAAATTTYEIFPPFLVKQDAYLEIVVTTGPATGATGTVDAKVEGDAVGVR